MAQTATERMANLRKANTVRLATAAVLRDVENGDLTLSQAIANAATANVPVFELVERLPFPNTPGRARARATVGTHVRRCPQQAGRLLERAGLTPYNTTKTIASLTARQAAALIAEWEATCDAASR